MPETGQLRLKRNEIERGGHPRCSPPTCNVRENQSRICPLLYKELEDREYLLVLEPRRPCFGNDVTQKLNLRNGRVALTQPHGLPFAIGAAL